MLATISDTDPPLLCMACGSDSMVAVYRAPVYVFISKGQATRVVVADEESEFAQRVWCRRCGETCDTGKEPELGTWPAWEVGW